jgi:hypothetical protein
MHQFNNLGCGGASLGAAGLVTVRLFFNSACVSGISRTLVRRRAVELRDPGADGLLERQRVKPAYQYQFTTHQP